MNPSYWRGVGARCPRPYKDTTIIAANRLTEVTWIVWPVGLRAHSPGKVSWRRDPLSALDF